MKKKLIQGFGINDADYCVTERLSGKIVRVCPFYLTWTGMLRRCKCKNYIKRFPTYQDCTVCEEWLLFSNFKKWMEQQRWEGRQLDKDLINCGNKTYCPENCVFIDGALNTFLIDSRVKKSNLPTGVSFHKRDKKYHSQCNNQFTGKKEHLGYFDNADDAHLAWKKRKHELALMFAEIWENENVKIADALRNRYM